MKAKILRNLAVVVASLTLGVGAAYASFVSNNVGVTGVTLTTGEANLKLCDSSQGTWLNTISPPVSTGLLLSPGEERDIFSDRIITIGNDDGNLGDTGDSNSCTNYGTDPVGHSSVTLKLVPKVTFEETACIDPLPSNLKLRFEINGQTTDAKTLNSWSSNATQFEPTFPAGAEGTVKTMASLSSTATAQQASCTFNISFTGKQI